MRSLSLLGVAAIGLVTSTAWAGHTNNIMITGYWPPTGDMIRPFSTNSAQNPGGWIGQNWEGRGYNIYSFFPEFDGPDDEQGHGDFPVDYQATSEDWWRITSEIRPVAIITFSWTPGSASRQYKDWELEGINSNWSNWVNDYEAPYQPTPSPPDASVPAGTARRSTLPMGQIQHDVGIANVGVKPVMDMYGGGGTFLSEYIGYHGLWYQSLHSSSSDPYWNVAAGHIHVGAAVTTAEGFAATQITLRTLIKYVNTIVPEPSSVLLLLPIVLLRRRAA